MITQAFKVTVVALSLTLAPYVLGRPKLSQNNLLVSHSLCDASRPNGKSKLPF